MASHTIPASPFGSSQSSSGSADKTEVMRFLKNSMSNKHLDKIKTLNKRIDDKAGLLTDIIIFDGAEHAKGLN